MEQMFRIPVQKYPTGLRRQAVKRVKAGALERNP
jgi:hypothetical protein